MDRNRHLLKYGKATSTAVISLFFYAFLISIAFVFVYPFLYMFSTSFKTYQDLHDVSVTWIPSTFNIENYKLALEHLKVEQTMVNSVFVTVIATLGHVLSGAFIGYGLSRFNFPGKNIVFFGTILSVIIPIQVFIIPLYVNYTNLGMINTFWPFILPSFLGFGLRGGISIFVFRQFFYGFPAALEEAALIDGCGRIKSFFRIALPSAGPAILVTSVLFMVWHWNDYYEPSLYLTGGTAKAFVTQMLPQLYNLISAPVEESASMDINVLMRYHEGVVMAATAVATAPPLIAYLFLQKKFMVSIERTGLVG